MRKMYPSRGICRAHLLSLLCCLLAAPAVVTAQKQHLPEAKRQQAAALIQKSEANSGFTENKGQIEDQNGKANRAVKYLLHMPGLNVQLRQTGFSYDAWVAEKSVVGSQKSSVPGQPEPDPGLTTKFQRVDVELEGANINATLLAGQPTGGLSNFVGGEASCDGVRDYRTVTYKDIYPGIDLEFEAKRGKDKPVEYNFIVHPGADASLIKLKYNSDGDIALKDGEISMKLDFGTLVEKIPASYTEGDGHNLAVQYKPLPDAENVYAFNVPDYDHGKTLVIDPTPSLIWATYLGGTIVSPESITGIDADAGGNIYVSGYTGSSTNIGTAGTHKATITSGTFSMLVKYNSAGVRTWGTYYGPTGAGNNYGAAVKVSGTSVYMCGSTGSSLGTMSGTGFQSTFGGNYDGYLVKFNASYGTRIWDTYYGTNGLDYFLDMAIAPNDDIIAGGMAYVNSSTNQSAITTAGTVQPSITATASAYVTTGMLARFNASGGRVWGTYFGGSVAGGANMYLQGIDIDANGYIYIDGTAPTNATVPATTGAYKTTNTGGAGVQDGFIAKISSAGDSTKWCTYFGGSGSDALMSIKVDKAGNVVVGGYSNSSTGIATTGAYQTVNGGGNDIVLAKFANTGSIVWSTYFGGSGSDYINGSTGLVAAHCLDLDENNNIYLAGSTTSSGLSAGCAYATTASNGIVAKFLPSGFNSWSSYYSMSAINTLKYMGNTAFAVGGSATVTTMGTAGTQQPAYGGGNVDAFLARFNEGTLPSGFALAASTISPLSQNTCAVGLTQTITGNSVTIAAPLDFTTPLFYQWQQATTATGPWTNMAGEVFKDLAPPSGSTSYYYRRLIRANTGCLITAIDSSAAAYVGINSFTAPTANADGPAWFLCPGGTVTLNGSGTPNGTSTSITGYEWYAGNATTPAVTTASYTPTVSTATTYTLKVTDNNGCANIDQVTVTPVAANAGPAAGYCSGTAGVLIGAAPVASPSVAYAWSPATALTATNIAQPVASPSGATTYTLTTTVTQKNNSTCNTTSTVVVTPVAAPPTNFAGPDTTICKSSTASLGVTGTGYTYTWTPSTYLTNTTSAVATFNAGTNSVQCPLTYTVTAVSGGCAFQDQVQVSVVDADIDVNASAYCGPILVSGLYTSTNCTGASYAWNVVSGPGAVVNTRNSGADAYLRNTGTAGGTAAVFNRSTILNGKTCTSTNVTVNKCTSGGGPDCSNLVIKLLSSQGCPKVFTGSNIQLGVVGVDPSAYNFSWSPAGIMNNATASSVTITSASQTTVSVTVTSKADTAIHCSASLPINDPAWSRPTVSNLPNRTTCPGVPVSIGTAAISGYTYAWTPNVGLNDTSLSNPTANVNVTTAYNVAITETLSGCRLDSTISVTVPVISFDAGPNRTVCSGGRVTLGTTPGGSYTYHWSPANAAYQNGTDSASSNPQVLFGGSSSQTFTVAVTDPVSSCVLYDTVTLSSTVAAGTYAGAAPAAICPAGNAMIGAAASPGATYSWSPTTALSCTSCAKPTASPTTTTTYTVYVSYPGCSTPLSDAVTVTVGIPPHNYPDVAACPATPTAIGGTVASAMNYSWTPSAGLSCTTCASPNATVNTPTTYIATLFFGNNCSDTDQVVVTPKFTTSAGPDTTVCIGSSATLGVPSVANLTYSWSPSTNLSAANVAQPVITPTTAGTKMYFMTATGTGANAGCTFVDTVIVTVPAAISYSAGPNRSVCTGGTVTLGTTPGGSYTYSWTPATASLYQNGTSSTSANPQVQLSGSTQTFTVVVTNPATGCTATSSATLSNAISAGSLAGAAKSVCPNSTATLGAAALTGATYSWSPATGLSCTGCAQPTASPATTTTYTVSVSYPGCSTPLSDTVTVTVNTIPAHNYPNITACPATPTAIGGSLAGATAYSWSPGLGLSCTACASPNSTAQTVTIFTATITFSNGCSDTDQVAVTPLFIASAKPDAKVCAGSAVTLGLPAVANVSYSWSPATNLSATNVAQPSATPAAAGTTTYTLTATGSGPNAGCVLMDSMLLSAVSPPAFTVSATSSVICAGNSTTLSATPVPTTGSYTYQWTPAASVASPTATSTVATPTATTQYKLIQLDQNSGCANSQKITVVVNPNPITATGGTVTTCVNGGSVLPLTTNSTGYTYSWSPSLFLSNAFIQNPTSYVNTTTTYTVTITDNTSNCTKQVKDTLTTGVCAFALSGNIFRDANGYTDNLVNASGSVTTLPAGIYVSLINSAGNVVSTVAVASNGSFSFPAATAGTYSVVVGNTSAGSATPALPAGYVSTGANLGTGTGGGTNTLGKLSGITISTAPVSNANIAINQRPLANAQGANVSTPAVNSFVTLNSSTSGTGGALTGSDGEDQPVSGSLSGKAIAITSLPANGELWYNGAKITLGTDGINPPSPDNPASIPNYNPALLQYKRTGTGYTSASFDFAFVDASGTQGTPATYAISWSTAVVAQSITTSPATGAQKLPMLVGTDQSGAAITSYTVNAPTTGTLSYCSNGSTPPACTGGSLTPVTGATALTPAQAATLYYAPVPGTTGTPSFTYTATSDNGTSSPATVSMPVYNLPPTAMSTTTKAITAGSATGTALPPLQASDIDGAVSSYSVTPPSSTEGTVSYCSNGTSPCTGTVTALSAATTLTPAQAATLSFVPATGFTGTASFPFTATDNSGNMSSPAVVSIPVTTGGAAPSNLPPVTQSYTTQPISNTGGNTPIPSLAGSDPDGSIAGYTITTPPSAAQGTLKYCSNGTLPCTGTLTPVPATGTTALTPAQAATLQFSPNPANPGGTATFSYTATDNNGTPATGNISTVSIPVQNPAPTAANSMSAPVTSGSTNAPVSLPLATDNGGIAGYTITTAINPVTQGVLSYCSNGTSPCTGALATVLNNTALTPAQAATLVFTPAGGFTGTVPVTFNATDNNGAVSNTATMSIPVQSNAAPAAANYTAAPANANSAMPLSLAGALSGTPNAANAGSTITGYTVGAVPPAAQGALTYCTAPPSGGCNTPVTSGMLLTPAQAATLSFAPAAGYSGPVSFGYTAKDNLGNVSNIGAVSIPVINTPPVSNNVTSPAVVAGGPAVVVPIMASDADGSVSSYTINSLPPAGQGTLSYCATGSLPGCTQTPAAAGQTLTPAQAATMKFTPASSLNTSLISFSYSATDNTGAVSNSALAQIPAGAAPPAVPVAVIAANITTPPSQNAPVRIPALSGADQLGSPVTSYTVTAPPTGTLQYCSNGATPPACTGGSLTTVSGSAPLTPAQAASLYYTPAAGATGTPAFTYTATSANGTSTPATVSMPVYNAAPAATSLMALPVAQNTTATKPLPALSANDPDGTIASYTVSPPPASQGTLRYCTAGSLPACTGGTLTPVSGSTVLTPAQAATLAFTPATGFTGIAGFDYTATDNGGATSSPASVGIPVTVGGNAPANLPPVTQSYTAQPVDNTAGATPIAPLAGADADGSIASFTITTPPPAAQGALSYCSNGTAPCTGTVTPVPATGATSLTPAQAATLKFSPAASFSGPATFSFTATDNGTTPLTGNVSTVTIPVLNAAPLSHNVQSSAVAPGSTGTRVSGPSASDNGSVSSFTVTTAPNGATEGTLSYCSNGTTPCTGTVTPVANNTVLNPAQAATLSFTPVAGYTGTVNIPYNATDNNGATGNTATLSIPVNTTTPPKAADYTAAPVNANSSTPAPLGGALSAVPNAANTGGSIASYKIVSIPPAAQGTLGYCSNGTAPCTGTVTPVGAGDQLTPAQASTLSFQPSGGYSGPVSFGYTASDNQGTVSNLAGVSIPVSNQPPVARNVTTAQATMGAMAVPVPISGTDADGTVSSYTISTLPVPSDGSLSYCSTGSLPGCTPVAVAAGMTLTPAQAATLRFTPASGRMNSFISTFGYTATDNTGARSSGGVVSIPLMSPTPLPVTLVSFKAAGSAGCAVVLKWAVANESGIRSYTVERSTDARIWTAVRSEKALNSGAGAGLINYQTTDNGASEGLNYYRLRVEQTASASTPAGSTGDNYRYSATERVMVSCGQAAEIGVTPNPFRDVLTVRGVPAGSVIGLWSADGRRVLQVAASTTEPSTALSVGGLPPGAYWLRVTSADGATGYSTKVVKQ